MNLTLIKSQNFSKKARNLEKIKFIIIHYTGMQSMIASIRRLTDKTKKVSCHYLISREGKIFNMVNNNRVAWHAGKSRWSKSKNLNKNSIGIELVNKGHQFGYQNFTSKQINTLIKLCKILKRKFKIKNQNILGHSDISPLRKSDPGEKFPWKKLYKMKLGIWYSSQKTIFPKNLSKNEIRKLFFRNLHKIGYRYFNLIKSQKSDKLVVKAFQRRFRKSKITGTIDLECLKISQKLAKFNR